MSRSILIVLFLLALLTVLVAGCPKPPATTPVAPVMPAKAASGGVTGELTVFVPCGVAGPFGEIQKLFQARNPGLKIRPEVANIDVQTKLIADGKGTPDAWIALGDRETQKVVKAGMMDGEPTTFAFNSIAFIVKKGNPAKIAALKDLTKSAVKTISLPTPENSSGYYCQRALEKAGLWKQLQSKLVVVEQPSQVKMMVTGGKADVGVVYYPCTRETRIVGGQQQEVPGKAQLLGKIPSDLVGQIPAQAAVIKGAANPTAGRAFVQFLLTDEAQEVWENWAWDRAKEPSTGARTTLYLYCGAGLRPMMDPVIDAYKKLKPNIRIDAGYAGSGCLLSQLTFGKRGDLYMPGEDFYLKQASDKGYVTSQKPVGYFEPVLLVQKGNPKGIKTLQDLTKPGLKVAVGEPDACAVGRAADEMLKQAKLLDGVSKNIVLRAGNVPELGNAVKLKSVDVAVVWNITAAQYPADCEAIAVDKQFYKPSLAPIGLLKFSKYATEAQAFIDFLCSPDGQKIVKDSGMKPM